MPFKMYLQWSVLLIIVLAGPSFGIGLNEIMFDPGGNENTDEFVELYNEASSVVNLSGWMLTDGEGTDTIVTTEQGLSAAPHQYVLILDPDYFTSGSTTYDGIVPEDALVVTISGSTFGSRGFSNSNPETVSLLDSQGTVVSSYAYTVGNLTSRSDEKILATGGNESTNWADAHVANGTPGSRNSVTPPDRDLAITRMEVVPRLPRPGELFGISLLVTNLGLNAMLDSLILYQRSPTGSGDSIQGVSRWSISMLSAGDSLLFSHDGLLTLTTPQYYHAELTVKDDRPENNVRDLTVSPSGLIGSVVINEIMYSPDVGMSEWVELLNTSISTILLSGWSFGDGTSIADSSRRYPLPALTLNADSFLVLAADSSVFFDRLPTTAQVVIMNSGTVTLNNNGDSLLLWDQTESLIDRVDYRPSWGGDIGISLERVSSTSAGNDPQNWASSLDSTGGTPGRVNSRAMSESSTSKNILIVEPNPFTPNGDGRDDLLAIRFELEYADSRIDLKIYDLRGREVRRLASNASVGYAGAVLWDGTDGSGRDLPTGMYIIYLEALGKGGTRIQTARRVVALARPS